VDFFTQFKTAHEDVQIGLKSFVKLKPYFVKRLKDFNTCCCKYHQEMVKIKDGFNMRSTDVHHGDDHHSSCSCQCDSICTRPVNNSLVQDIVTCQGIHHIFKRSMDLWSQSFCPTPLGSFWYKISCVKGECTLCGFHRILLCDKELDPTNPSLMSLRRFENLMVGKTRNNEMKEVTCLEHKRTNHRMFLAYATPKVWFGPSQPCCSMAR